MALFQDNSLHTKMPSRNISSSIIITTSGSGGEEEEGGGPSELLSRLIDGENDIVMPSPIGQRSHPIQEEAATPPLAKQH